jgi:predicted RNase H-like HicB family nuclease
MKDLIFKTVENFETLMENLEDVFNAVIETLIKNNYELPDFNTLSRLINNKRYVIPSKINI